MARAHQRVTPPNAPSQEATRFNQRADGIPKRVSVTASFVLVRLLANGAAEDTTSLKFIPPSDPLAPPSPPFLRPQGLRAPPRHLLA
jgi:hypothetical protein